MRPGSRSNFDTLDSSALRSSLLLFAFDALRLPRGRVPQHPAHHRRRPRLRHARLAEARSPTSPHTSTASPAKAFRPQRPRDRRRLPAEPLGPHDRPISAPQWRRGLPADPRRRADTPGEAPRRGYVNGIFAKVSHLAPQRFCWTSASTRELANGRDPKHYYEHATAFLADAKKEAKPFFLMVDSQDPHRPWPGGDGEREPARPPPTEASSASRPCSAAGSTDRTRSPCPVSFPTSPRFAPGIAQYFHRRPTLRPDRRRDLRASTRAAWPTTRA